jgi:Tol biopolymer transport system component
MLTGESLGHYRVFDKVGEGGMGEVYRARDTTLNRDVAIKVLPELFAADAERVARFEREAQTLASLNHPHIAQIYGLERAGPVRALVMELVEGEDLAGRIARGALPLDEALPIAHQIAEALEAAHEQGIIHRDLKPANIKVRSDGTVKVLDFGLAKALEGSGPHAAESQAGLMNSPTMSFHATAVGLILGTAGYMAPEQARGVAVDRRVDVWAFGVVLFEMLSGRAAFSGDTIADVLASVLKNDLEWGQLPAALPAPILTLLRRCLNPDRRNRLRDIGEARIAIAEYLSAPPAGASPETPTPPAARLLPWYVATGVLALALVAALVWGRRPDEPGLVVRYEVHAPAAASIATENRSPVALSPDGRLLVFAAQAGGATRLYLQRRDDFEAHPLPGTEGASDPAFSSDGRSIAFSADTHLKLLRLEGGVTTLAPVNDPRGASWIDMATLVYAPDATGPIHEISTSGGASRAITTVEPEAGERTHRWPHVLPGGRYVLFTVGMVDSPDNYDDARIDAVDRETGERRTVLHGASLARYAPTGHLLYARGGILLALDFDLKTLTTSGTAVPVLQAVGGDATTGAAHVTWASDGTMAYVAGESSAGQRRLVWADRKGGVTSIELPTTAGTTLYNDARLSPDGSRVAVAAGTSGRADIWVHHFQRGTLTRLTFTGSNATPFWSADGRDIYYMSLDGRRGTLLRIQADGGVEPTELATFDRRSYLKHISRDGTWGLLDRVDFGTSQKTDIIRFTLPAAAEATPIVATSFDEYAGAVSPDERWIAYQSDESARPEIYVRAADGSPGRWQVSSGGGEEPMWSPDARELYFRAMDRLMVVPIEIQPIFRPGTPALLFEGIYNLRSDTGVSYDVHPKGDGFLMVRQVSPESSAGTIRVALNWFDELRRITAGQGR